MFLGSRKRATVVATLGGSSCIISLDGAFLDSGVEANRTSEDKKGSTSEQNNSRDMYITRER